MASLIATLKEEARQKRTDDQKFLERHLFFFELRVPQELATFGGFLGFFYPLILPPRSYQLSEPFSVEAQPTQGGGLYVEENGIVLRRITIQGHTGWKPRQLKLRLGDAFPAILDPAQKSYARELPEKVLDAVSGHRHFQYLQDSVFRTYADLKRDPSTAADTQLILHIPQDDEHWLVAPEEFSLDRSASSPLVYNYSIRLLVLDKADAQRADFSEDKSLLDSLKDAIRSVRQGIAKVTGAIQDLQAIAGEIRSVFAEIDGLIDDCTSIVDAATDFVDGLKDLVDIPLMFLDSVTELADSVNGLIQAHEDLGVHVVRDFPEAARQKFRQLVDGLEMIGMHPQAFRTTTDQGILVSRELQESRRGLSDSQRELADATGTPSTFDQVENQGSLPTPGDVVAAEGEQLAGSEVRVYRSARPVRVEAGDSLASLAARYLGDARLWQYIARLNGLHPPFVDGQADAPLRGSYPTGGSTGADYRPFPLAVGVGGQVLIPVSQQSPRERPVATVLGVDPEESSVEDYYLGTDLRLDPVGTAAEWSTALKYDLVIDVEHGSQDVLLVSGKDNLTQALRVRLITERGMDLLYQKLGAQRVVGMGLSALDYPVAKSRLVDAVAADPRVSSVREVSVAQVVGEPMDRLRVDMVVNVRGMGQALDLPVEV